LGEQQGQFLGLRGVLVLLLRALWYAVHSTPSLPENNRKGDMKEERKEGKRRDEEKGRIAIRMTKKWRGRGTFVLFDFLPTTITIVATNTITITTITIITATINITPTNTITSPTCEASTG
jgi:hypothetical protein